MKQIFLDDLRENKDIRKLISSFSCEDIIDISISYTSDFKNAKKLRKIVDIICDRKKVAPKWKTRLILICDELNNNAIEYGSERWGKNIFRIILQEQGSKKHISLSVTDTWSGSQAKTAKEMDDIRKQYQQVNYNDHHSIRGRGLFLIIHQLVDTLVFSDSISWGLTVRIEKDLS